MTTLVTKSTFIAPLSDLSDVLAVRWTEETSVDSKTLETRRYAGGRKRLITSPGTTRTVKLQLRHITRDNFEVLRAWVGVPILVRDTRFRRFAAVYASLDATEFRPSNAVADVSVTLDEISWTEIV